MKTKSKTLQEKLEKKQKRILKKANRNTNKQYATTKSFNNKDNDFVPEPKQERNPDSVLYLQLKNKGSLPKKGKKVVTYKQWQDIKMSEALKKV